VINGRTRIKIGDAEPILVSNLRVQTSYLDAGGAIVSFEDDEGQRFGKCASAERQVDGSYIITGWEQDTFLPRLRGFERPQRIQ